MITNVTIDYVRNLILKRPFDAHKGSMGHALLIAGQKGMAGAALLASRACMRSGVGKLTIRTQEANREILQLGIPEAILSIHSEDDIHVNPDLSAFRAVAVGPAIGVSMMQADFLDRLFQCYSHPLVIDADAINVLAKHHPLADMLPNSSILTPHKLELSRLLGNQYDNEDEELKATINFAVQHKVLIVMKGPHSRIISSDGHIFVNTTGNPGMATAGSGDVLTGILLGLLTRGYQPLDAAVIGVFLHGLAGDLASMKLGFESLIASDIVDFLPYAFKRLTD